MHVIIGEQIGWHLSMLAESLRRRHFVANEVTRQRLRAKYSKVKQLSWSVAAVPSSRSKVSSQVN